MPAFLYEEAGHCDVDQHRRMEPGEKAAENFFCWDLKFGLQEEMGKKCDILKQSGSVCRLRETTGGGRL